MMARLVRLLDWMIAYFYCTEVGTTAIHLFPLGLYSSYTSKVSHYYAVVYISKEKITINAYHFLVNIPIVCDMILLCVTVFALITLRI